eukprot:gene7655-10418_t
MLIMDIEIIFVGCMTLIAISGAIIFVIHHVTPSIESKNNDTIAATILAQGLWKIPPTVKQITEKKLLEFNRKRYSWWKLVFAGIMISCLIVSSLIKAPFFITKAKGSNNQKVLFSIGMGICVFVGWLVFILYFWYFIATKVNEEDIKSKNENTSELKEVSGWENKRKKSREIKDFSNDNKSKDNSKSIESETEELDLRLPITVITGFLGSGKTTLVRNILQNTIGMKILVIENEIGSEGIDHELLMQHTTKEEIILMSNGCICCTVRKDLLTTFHTMLASDAFSKLDWIVIETTGLADPAPLIQSLYMDEECRKRMRLDSVITVVDAKHFPIHTEGYFEKLKNIHKTNSFQINFDKLTKSSNSAHGDIPEAILQILFADRVLLNKVDLVTSEELEQVTSSIQRINPQILIMACEKAIVPIDELLDIRAFDPINNLALINNNSDTTKNNNQALPILINRDSSGNILKKNIRINFNNSNNSSPNQRTGICTFTLSCVDPLDLNKFNKWITSLLQIRGTDIFRMKGILFMHGYDQQFVVHAIHMIFDGELGPKWSEGLKPINKLVFIGVNLDKSIFEKDFLKCKYNNHLK